MKALVFAAGLGTRLRPLTNDRPKALVEVGGVPMLERVLRRLIDAGCDDITVNIHHFGEKIIDFLHRRDHSGVTLRVSDERSLLLDTGGGILKARRWLDGPEPFLVHNADILTTLDLKAFVASHKESGALASLLVKSRETKRYFLFDNEMRLQGWLNRGTGETRPPGVQLTGCRELAFGGIHVVSPEIFPLLEEYAEKNGKVFSTTPFYIDICRRARVQGYEPPSDYLWLDVGKPETLKEANEIARASGAE